MPLSVDPSHKIAIKWAKGSFFFTHFSSKCAEIRKMKFLQVLSFSYEQINFTSSSFSSLTWFLNAVNGGPCKAVRSLMSWSLDRVWRSFLPIYWTQLTRRKWGLTRCCIFRGHDLPVDLASACSFSRIAYWRQSEESWALTVDSQKV